MRDRLRAPFVAALIAASAAIPFLPAVTHAAAYKVAVIVGPTGAQTSSYRSYADQVAAAATARGATVVKVYSPNATWANVKAAVNGANIIVWMGHGNGWPNPYTSPSNSTSASEATDRVNGWGLNRTTAGGDGDNWSTQMVYCGEKALLGTLASTDGAAQWSYCGGKTNTDGIHPAAGFVMIYAHACYTPGAGEGFDINVNETIAKARVANYSYPVLKLGASAYFATDYGDEDALVARLLDNPTMAFSTAFRKGTGYAPTALHSSAHPSFAGMSIYLQRTNRGNDLDYWYAFAGQTAGTLSGSPASSNPGDADYSPAARLTVRQGTHTGYRFNDAGGLVASRTATLATDSGANTSMLRTLPNQAGSWFYVVNGIWAGYWVRRSDAFDLAGNSAAAGGGDTTYDPPVRIAFERGTHTGYRFTGDGGFVAAKTVTLATASGANAASRSSINNQYGRWFAITNGAWAGYWIRESDVVHLP